MSTVVADAPAGEYTNQLGTVTNAVNFAVLVLTIIGAAWMMVSMFRKEYTAGKGSTVRSRLVLFLVFGDFLLGSVSCSIACFIPSTTKPSLLLPTRRSLPTCTKDEREGHLTHTLLPDPSLPCSFEPALSSRRPI